MAEDNEDYDYFDGPDIEDPVVEPTPEEIEEKQERDETIAVINGHKWRNMALSLLAIIVGAGCVWGYFHYYSPFVSEAVETGYVMKVEKRGLIWKTYEGDMATSISLQGTDIVRNGDFTFSIDNDSLAHQAMKVQTLGEKVTVRYKTYGGTLPWRGASQNIVIAIEPAE